MQVFTVQPSTLLPGIHSGNNGGNYSSSGTNMIQSQPINLATNSSAARRTDSFERADACRQDSIPLPLSSGRNVNHNHIEQQAQDLSIHSHQKPFDSKDPMNPLLDFCNIILTYTNYPDAFSEDYKPIGGALEGKRKAKSQQARIKMEFESTIQRPPQKRKIGNSSCSTIKQKPGRKPKGAKVVPPVPRLRPEAPYQHEEPGGMNGTRVKLEESRMNNRRRERKVSSPLNSVGESREGTHSSSSSTSSRAEERDSQPSNLFYPDDDRDESWEEVTCFCGKPFAGRPMIECEHCFVWHHMSCAKLRKTNVPKKFYCRDCKHMFPDFAQERQRRGSGNVACDTTQYQKTPVKPITFATKNGLSSATEVITPLPLTIPPPLTNYQSVSPKSPTSSLYFTPKEGNNLSQFPPVVKSSSSSTATNTQFRNRQHPYLNGNSESKNVHNSSSKPSTPPQSPPRKAAEKTKRRPTLNSASSGLYDDVLLPLKLNFTSIGNASHNGTSS